MSDSVQYLTNESGERTAVLLPISAYEKLLEDLDDLAVVAERKGEKPISAKELTKRLKRRGLI